MLSGPGIEIRLDPPADSPEKPDPVSLRLDCVQAPLSGKVFFLSWVKEEKLAQEQF